MNEIPLSLFIFMSAITIGLIIFSLIYRENFVRIITSFISMALSFVNSQIVMNGNLVMIQTDGTEYSYIPVTVPYLNYVWLFFAILSLGLTILFIMDEVHIHTQSVLEMSDRET